MNATDHERIKLEIAAFLAERLSDEKSSEVRDHLATCGDCAAIVEAWAPAALGFRQAGPELLESHPDSLTLLKVGRGEEQAGDELSRHLATCATCLLEVQGAGNGVPVQVAGPTMTTARPAIRTVSMALAAGLVLGLALATLWMTPGSRFAGSPGAIRLYTLEETVRSSDDGAVLEVDGDDTLLPLVMIPAVPQDAKPEEPFRIEIRNGSGELVYSGGYSAGELNRFVELSGVLTLLVPSQPEGDYTLQLISKGEPIQEFRFQVVQR